MYAQRVSLDERVVSIEMTFVVAFLMQLYYQIQLPNKQIHYGHIPGLGVFEVWEAAASIPGLNCFAPLRSTSSRLDSFG